MLKHCSPSTVDVSRRSRRNLCGGIGDDAGNDIIIKSSSKNSSSNHDSLSLNSCSATSSASSSATSSSSSSSSSVASSTRSSGRSSCRSPLYKDAATSPKSTYSRRRMVMTRQQQRRSVSVDATNASIPGGGVPIKVYARCLRSDIEYKTLSVSPQTTARELIWLLLAKFRMKHRDPNLFYLTMDISIRRTGIPLKRSLSLDDESRPVELKSCHPWGECKFTLQMRKGGVVRVYDSVLMAESKYKCLLISESTTAEEVIRMLFRCYGFNTDRVQRFCVVEQDVSTGLERRMANEERPVLVQSTWMEDQAVMRFVLKKAKGSNGIYHDKYDNNIGGLSEEDEDDDGTSSSDYSALRFRESPVSSSTRSSDSADSRPDEVDVGTSTSPQPQQQHLYLKNTRGLSRMFQTHQNNNSDENYISRSQISLHSLLDALPAASVDNDDSGSEVKVNAASTTTVVVASSEAAGSSKKLKKKKRTSLSSLSLDSRSSDYDSYFYI